MTLTWLRSTIAIGSLFIITACAPQDNPKPTSDNPTAQAGNNGSTGNVTPSTPANNSSNQSSQTTEKDFLTTMIPHHQQAIQMADLALNRANRPEIKQLAQAIKKDQMSEIDQMQALYKTAYGAELPAMATNDKMMTPDPNSGDNRGMMQSPMNSMRVDLETLKNAPDFDREFINQMISHHKMAVQMSQMVSAKTTNPAILTLANTIVKAQTAEIAQMQQWGRAWYKST